MSKHICPKCGYKFEDNDYSEYIPVENNDWSYFNVADGSFYAICDICHERFTKGYTKICEPVRSIKGDMYSLYHRRQYMCSECAKKWGLCTLGD